MGKAKGRDTGRAAHPPGDRQPAFLHHHCGVCLCGVRAWVEVEHFIIKGVEELSWKGIWETAVTIGGLAALYSVGAHWRLRELPKQLFFKGLTVSINVGIKSHL